MIFTIYKLNSHMMFATPVVEIDVKDAMAAAQYAEGMARKLNDGYQYSHYKPSNYN